MNKQMSFTISGDALILHRLPPDYPGRQEIRDYLRRGQARITNLETTLTKGDCCPSTFSGGTWLTAEKEVLEDLEDFGFNLYSIANNHMLDFSYGGLASTLAAMRERNLLFSGAGENLAQASRPAIAELPSGRVGFLAITSTFDDSARAGIQGPYLPGRPGINPMRHKEIYRISPEHMKALREIADAADVNVKNKRRYKTGYKLPAENGIFEFKDLLFQESDREGKVTQANARDLERTCRSIQNMKYSVDYVAVMLHSHEMKSDNMEDIDDFIIECAHAFADAGADLVIGGGTHQLKGIELYKGVPIFYSLGNFIYQNEFARILPPEFMDKYKLPYDTDPMEALAVRRSYAKNGGQQSKENYLSVLPYLEYEDGRVTKIELLPISLGYQYTNGFKAIPYPADQEDGDRIYDVLRRLSAPFGTRLRQTEHGIIEIQLTEVER